MTQQPVSSALLVSQDTKAIAERFRGVRARTEAICAPLEVEDYVVQPIIDVSPPKWHLAHTSWFFENFLLSELQPGYEPFHPLYAYLFNSYYILSGKFHPRVDRGNLSRPTVTDVYRYREHVTKSVLDLLSSADEATLARAAEVITLGMNHEEQHQELLLTDIKYILSCNPLEPVFKSRDEVASQPLPPLGWLEFAGGITEAGYVKQDDGFCFDNELPRHRVLLNDYRIASRLVTNGEYTAFMADGGYERPELWLSDGWATVQSEGWRSPLYWENRDGDWHSFTLSGVRKVDANEPVVHVSHYEADAFARWAGKRLPSEFEWEHAAESLPVAGNLYESGIFHPAPATADGPSQFYGDVWEWTQSAYLPYPGFKPLPGAVGEYNGKFMSSQMVLRGGSCATPAKHVRASYRNFFQPFHRWQFMGLRLAEDA
jgi:ergothioneine biosynthesis protein EgtB